MPAIKHSISIDAAPDRVYPLVSSGHGFTQWLATDVTDNRAEGTVDLGFFNRASVYRLKPVRLESTHRAEWICTTGEEWNGTKLLFELTPNKAGTLVRFSHADWQSETDYMISCTTVWGELMFRLKAAAEGRSRGPLFSATGTAY